MYQLIARLHIALLLFTAPAHTAGLRRRWRDDRGQATTEYALVLLAAALVALLVVAWATAGGGGAKVARLFGCASSTRSSRRSRGLRIRGDDRGQAAVEVALVLPLVVMFALGALQVAVVARDPAGDRVRSSRSRASGFGIR